MLILLYFIELMKKYLLTLLLTIIIFFWINNSTFAKQYLYFYGEGCPHCLKVAKYFKEENLLEKISLQKKETWRNKANAIMFSEYTKKMGIPIKEIWVPFLVIIDDNGDLSSKSWDTPIIEYFKNEVNKKKVDINNKEVNKDVNKKETSEQSIISLLITLFTTSLADSINPCVFAVMLLLLSTILTRSKSRKKAVLSGLMFVLAIFLWYAFLGRVLLGVLTSVGIGTGSTGYRLQIIIGIVWILIGLANLKDYFFPDVFPAMEVPLSWRPRMQKIVKGVLSPIGAFGIGLVLTMFLLPCTAGPYVVFTSTLSAYPEIVNSQFMLYLYLAIYNIIFIIPMLVIVGIVGFWFKSVEELGNLRKKNRLLIHLIVGLLMLGLGIYIITTVL